MSEYQYYEFAALERRLTKRDMERLRAVSSRGRITPSSFVNHYEWGDFKGDPMDWMARYFDAFVYFANWGSCCLSLRLPLAAFQRSDIEPYMLEPSLSLEATATHWIFSWTVDENEDPERFEEEDDGRGWMSRLVALRDELTRGDLRPLYLGWLAGTAFTAEDADLAPAVPAGLGELTPAQRALTEFIALDVDLLAAAATGSTDATDGARARKADLDAWLAECSREDLLAMVKPWPMNRRAKPSKNCVDASLPGGSSTVLGRKTPALPCAWGNCVKRQRRSRPSVSRAKRKPRPPARRRDDVDERRNCARSCSTRTSAGTPSTPLRARARRPATRNSSPPSRNSPRPMCSSDARPSSNACSAHGRNATRDARRCGSGSRSRVCGADPADRTRPNRGPWLCRPGIASTTTMPLLPATSRNRSHARTLEDSLAPR